MQRRQFLCSAAATLSCPAWDQAFQEANPPIQEFELRSARRYADPTRDVEVDVIVTGLDQKEFRVPTFWAGNSTWKWRFPLKMPGPFRFTTTASETSDAGLHGVEGEVKTWSNRGLTPGPPTVSENKRHLVHEYDLVHGNGGPPFFWLGDTWWMGLTERLGDDEFRELAADRRRKGFNVIQLVAGLYPDMDSFDPRGRGEGGFPWTPGYKALNPAWWDHADARVAHLANVGLTPCILGCWGYYLLKMATADLKRHWRTVIARWGAYPVVWCLAGEGSMPWYLSDTKDQDRKALEHGWTELARYVRKTDPFGRLISIHPSRSGRDVVTEPEALDFDMLQTGHGDYRSIRNTLETVSKAYRREPVMPVIQSEVCYEGIMNQCRQDIQRFMFWSSILNGCCGFTYGANGIWQVNRPHQPFGASPHGRNWGTTTWREAMNLPGGRQVGLAAKFLRTLPWQEMEPHPEWVSPNWNEDGHHNPSAAGIPRKLRIIYTPTLWNPPTLRQLEPGVTYRTRLWNPSTGKLIDFGSASAQASNLPHFPEQRDWVIVLEA